MTMRNSWPGPSGVTTTTDARIVHGGLVEDYANGTPRAGLFPVNLNAVVTARSDMNVDIAAFQGVAVQFGGPILIANDGTIQLPAVLVSPASGTNYYVVYAKQDEATSPGTDADNLPKVGQVLSTVSFAAARATLPTGALELATVQVPSGVSATNAGGVTITQTFLYTAAEGGTVPVRNATELAAWTPADASLAWQIDIQTFFERIGGVWVPFSSPWQSFTPSWTATNVAPVVGNGSLTGRFAYVAPKTIAVRYYLTFGSTSGGGSGPWSLTLPPGLTAHATGEQALTAKVFLAGPGSLYGGVATVAPGASTITPRLPASASGTFLLPAQNADASAAAGTGIPVVSGQYSYATGSNMVIEGIIELS